MEEYYDFTDEQEVKFGITTMIFYAALIWLYLSDFGIVPSFLQ